MECLFAGFDNEKYLSEETEGEKIDNTLSASKKAKRHPKEKSKSEEGIGEGYVAAQAKRVAQNICEHCKHCKRLLFHNDGSNQPEKTVLDANEIDSVDSWNIVADSYDNETKATSNGGFGKADVAATPTKADSNLQRHASAIEPEASPSSNGGSSSDSDDPGLREKKSNFPVPVNRANISNSKGNRLMNCLFVIFHDYMVMK